jgi:glyoxylase-like metal-dependent hydrolase (beta-lactamase superfamily II)
VTAARELAPGLWHWQAPHPEWSADRHWSQLVSSCAIDDGTRLLLFDPLAVPEELLSLAAQREPVIVLTAPWHERGTRTLVEAMGAPVYTASPDTAQDIVRKYGVTLQDAGDGSPDLRWLLDGGAAAGEVHLVAAGDRLPFGIEAFPGRERNDFVLWVDGHGAVICGDALADFGDGFQINPVALTGGVTREQVVTGLRPLLQRDVELVLPAHGAPTDRAALERALA